MVPPVSFKCSSTVSGVRFRSKVQGFTLVELLAVLAVISVLSTLVIPSLQGTRANSLAASGNKIFDLTAMARQNSISKNAYTAVVIKNNGSGAYSSYTLLELVPQGDGSYADWQTVTAWRYLPEGIVFSPETFTSTVNFLSASASPPSPLPQNLFQGKSIDLSANTIIQIYRPDGTLTAGQPLRLRLVEGVVTSSGSVTYTHPNSVGLPANYYDLVFLRDTGQTKIERL